MRFGQRDYDPATGRFTSRDPILQSGGLNVYAYVNGNPVSHRDPTGLAEGGGFIGLRCSPSASSSPTATAARRSRS